MSAQQHTNANQLMMMHSQLRQSEPLMGIPQTNIANNNTNQLIPLPPIQLPPKENQLMSLEQQQPGNHLLPIPQPTVNDSQIISIAQPTSSAEDQLISIQPPINSSQLMPLRPTQPTPLPSVTQLVTTLHQQQSPEKQYTDVSQKQLDEVTYTNLDRNLKPFAESLFTELSTNEKLPLEQQPSSFNYHNMQSVTCSSNTGFTYTALDQVYAQDSANSLYTTATTTNDQSFNYFPSLQQFPTSEPMQMDYPSEASPVNDKNSVNKNRLVQYS